MTFDDYVVSPDGVRRAAATIAGKAIRTPLIENDLLNEITGGRVFLKAEVLQRCGSFKFRGAYNLLSQLTDDERAKGILAWSSGNHAQGVARAAKMFGAAATIVMPADTPEIKAANVRRDGAAIVTYDRYNDDREAIAREIQAERGMILAPSYDHPLIIEGQGTVALEVAEDLSAAGHVLDTMIICCGGGGLTSGCATILSDMVPDAEVWIAEPEGFDEAWATISSGQRHYADVKRKTICDAIATPTPGELTLPILQKYVRGGVSLTEDEVRAAVLFAFQHLKLVVEPGGAVALAAVLAGKVNTKGKTIALTLSGGNIDPALFSTLTQR